MRETRPDQFWLRGVVVLASVVAANAPRATAEPLPKEVCERLKTEHAGLEAGGIKDLLAKGPVWGRANLSADKLRDIERYITLEEQLSFRCGLAKARLTLPFAEEDAPPQPPAEAQKVEASQPAAKPKPKPKPKATASEAAPATAAAPTKPAAPAPATKPSSAAKSETDGDRPPPRPAAKPKPKIDDAYRPPAPPDATADPFARQLQLKTQ